MARIIQVKNNTNEERVYVGKVFSPMMEWVIEQQLISRWEYDENVASAVAQGLLLVGNGDEYFYTISEQLDWLRGVYKPNPKTPDNRDIVAINRIPVGYTMYFTGRSDNIANGTYCDGESFLMDINNPTKVFQSLNHFYLIGGRVIWDGASISDKVSAKLYAPATTGLVNQQGDYTKVELIPSSGLHIIVPTPLGFGDWELELSATLPNTSILKCVPVPAVGNDGFFDYDSDTNVLTRNETQTGGYNLFDFPIRLFTFVNEIPGRPSSETIFEASNVVGKLLYNSWQIRLSMETASNTAKCHPLMTMSIQKN